MTIDHWIKHHSVPHTTNKRHANTDSHYRKACVASSWGKTWRMPQVHAVSKVSVSQSRFQSHRGWSLLVLVHVLVWSAQYDQVCHLHTIQARHVSIISSRPTIRQQIMSLTGKLAQQNETISQIEVGKIFTTNK